MYRLLSQTCPGTVYLAPVTFGFGPASHAFAIATALRAMDPSVRLVGVADGIAADLLVKTDVLDEILVEDRSGGLPPCVGRSDPPEVVVSIADFDRARAARVLGLPVVVVDALYWMWDREPLAPSEVDRYLCLAFPGVEERLARSPDRSQMKVVPQILPHGGPSANQTERSGALLNFGGAVAPFGSNPKLLAALVRIVFDATGEDEELLVACSSKAASVLLAEELPDGPEVAELAFEEMARALSTRRTLFTLPGLSIMWESLSAAIPTVVLPAANYSQHRQLASYVRFFERVPFLTWDDLPGYASLPEGLAEDEGGERALGLGERFAADAVAQRALSAMVEEALAADLDVPALRGGHPWTSFDGATEVARETIDLCAQSAV